MAQYQSDCPRCGARLAAFTPRFDHPVPGTNGRVYQCLCICGVCGEASLLTFGLQQPTHPPTQAPLMPTNVYMLLSIEPKPAQPPTPEHVPERVVKLLQQSHAALTAQHWDSAGAMARKALDVATKMLAPDLASLWLKKRIETLGTNGRLTPDLTTWAMEIKTLGDDASHDVDEFTADEAKQIYAFTEMFLQYVYTMPGMLAARRNNTAPAQPPQA